MCGSILFFFLIIEFALRLTGLQTVKPNPPQVYQKHDNAVISYTLKPNINEKAFRSVVTTDENGFRINTQTREAKTKHKPTIAVLGDSITFGYGVENNETLPARLEERMPDFHFLNTGVPGYLLSQEVALYNSITRKMDPEAVMIVFFWNDLDGFEPGQLDDLGILRQHGWTPKEQVCQPINEGILQYLPKQCWLDTHSAFYKAFIKMVNMVSGNKALEQTREKAAQGEVTDPVNMENLQTYIKQLTAFTATLPVKHYFVIWPDRYVHTESRQALITAAEKLEYIVIDLTDIFGNNAPTLGWDTVHPHPDTIQKAAEYIESIMRSKTL